MANLGYQVARQLRKNNIEADLLLEKNPPKGSDPLVFDPSLQNQYPEWIHFYDKTKLGWKIDLIKIMRNKKYDLVHAYVELPIFAYISRKPFIANTQGSDFRELAFSNSLRGFLLRRAYRKAKIVLFFQPDHFPLFSKLNLSNGIFLPPLWDTSFFKPQPTSENQYSEKYVIFHPANLEWRLKGNDIFLKGFADFVKNNPDSLLIIIDRGIDSEKTHKLVDSLEILDKVKYVKGPLNSTDLLHYYNLTDVVADQFVLGALGSIGWETFSCSKPLLAFVHEEQYKTVYGESPPIVNASTSLEVSKGLEYLKDKKIRNDIGKEARKWIQKYHSAEIFSKKLITIYDSILQNIGVDEIKEKLSKITIPQD